MLKKPNAPLSQVIRRLSERKGHRSACRSKYSAENIPKNEHKKGPLPYEYRGYSQFSDIQWRNLHFSIRDSDSCIRVDNEIGIIRNIIVSESSDVKFLYECFRVVTDFFDFPLPSSDLGIFKVSDLTCTIKCASFTEIDCKNMRLPYRGHYIVVPLLHQFI